MQQYSERNIVVAAAVVVVVLGLVMVKRTFHVDGNGILVLVLVLMQRMMEQMIEEGLRYSLLNLELVNYSSIVAVMEVMSHEDDDRLQYPLVVVVHNVMVIHQWMKQVFVVTLVIIALEHVALAWYYVVVVNTPVVVIRTK